MKAGKSWNTSEAAVALASGTPLFDRFAVDEPGPVLMFCGEGGEGNILRRLRAVAEAKGLTDPDGLPMASARACPTSACRSTWTSSGPSFARSDRPS